MKWYYALDGQPRCVGWLMTGPVSALRVASPFEDVAGDLNPDRA